MPASKGQPSAITPNLGNKPLASDETERYDLGSDYVSAPSVQRKTPSNSGIGGLLGNRGNASTKNNTIPLSPSPSPLTPEKQSTPDDIYSARTLGEKHTYAESTEQSQEPISEITPSWEKNAQEVAWNQYQEDIEKARQDNLAQRQELEKQGTAYQTQADMQKYVNEQSIEKAGWTGGTVLDQNRQRQYLEESIKASMFSAMELQKYGYESQLQAARLAYDSNMAELAMEYYQNAVQNALNEAQVTGVYFSAEQKDLLAQQQTAQAILADETASAESKEHAQKVMDYITQQFGESGLSAQGMKTLAMLEYESNERQTTYSYYKTTLDGIVDTNSEFIWDNAGQYEENRFSMKTIDFNSASKEELINYLTNSWYGEKNVATYIKAQLNQAVMNYLTYCGMKEDKDTGNVTWTKDPDIDYFRDYISTALPELSSFISKLGNDELMKYMPSEGWVAHYPTNSYDFQITFKLNSNSGFTVDLRVNEKTLSEVFGNSNTNDNTNENGNTGTAWGSGNTQAESDFLLVDSVNSYFSPDTYNNMDDQHKVGYLLYGDPNKTFFVSKNSSATTHYCSTDELIKTLQDGWDAPQDGTDEQKNGTYSSQYNLYSAIIRDANAGKIKAGQIISTNYGKKVAGRDHYIMYLGNGQWAIFGGHEDVDEALEKTKGFKNRLYKPDYDTTWDTEDGCFVGSTRIMTNRGWSYSVAELYRISRYCSNPLEYHLSDAFVPHLPWVLQLNHRNGCINTAPPILVYRSPRRINQTIIKLVFDLGASKRTIKIIHAHAFLRFNERDYVTINAENVLSFARNRTEFVAIVWNEAMSRHDIVKATIVKAKVYHRTRYAYNVITNSSLNCVANDLVTMCEEPWMLYNNFRLNKRFEFDSSREEWLEKFGRLDHIAGIPQEVFQAFDAEQLFVAAHRARLTNEAIIKRACSLLEVYKQYLTTHIENNSSKGD